MTRSVLGARGGRWFLPVAALLTALVVSLPAGTFPRAALHLAVAGASGLMVLAGVRLHQPRQPKVWYAMGAGLLLLFAGDFAWRIDALSATGIPALLPLADALSLLGYVWVGVGGVLLLRCRKAGRDRDGLIDAAIFSVVAALLIWHFVIAPEVRLEVGSLDAATALLYPLGDIALFALMLRLVLLPGARVRSFWYLLSAMAIAFVSNLANAAFHDSPEVTAGAAGFVLMARAFLAAAALDPSMRVLTEPEPMAPRQHHTARLLVLAGCLAVVPTLLGFQDLWGGGSNRVLLMIAAVALTTLVLLRLGLVMADRDIAQRQLSHLALHDPLTGLPNRRLLLDRVSMALARSARRHGEVAVLFCDIDRFKVVNDSLGHAAGDELLVHVAARLRQAVRPDDTVARLGGDEFVICCEGLDGPEALRAIAERVTRVLSEPIRVAGEDVFVTVSIGLASAAGGADVDPEMMIRQADTAMYLAKAAGRDRIECADPEVADVRSMRLERENALRRAIDKGGLRLEYQPVLDLSTGATSFVEALVRWGLPDGGLLQPDAFIPLAEESGLIVPLGEWVLEEALTQLATWHAAGRNLGCGMSVNVSARQLRDPGFALFVQRALARTGVSAPALILEITEQVLMEESAEELASLEALRRLGVQLAVDDFGTRYSSLAYLKRLPVSALKIDRTFVGGVVEDPHDAAIVAAIVTLGHTLGLRVTAEGVETAEQLAAVEALGCDLAQGFYLGAAVPAAEAARVRPLPLGGLGHRTRSVPPAGVLAGGVPGWKA